MREILFRGKGVDGEWIKGYYVVLNNEEHRIYDGYAETDCGDYYPGYWTVDPKTVGQYTGLTDKNVNRIFEGDIIRVNDTENAIVEYDETSAFYMAVFNQAESDFGSLIEQYSNVEVIGNIYDNPELLEGE